MEDKQNLGIFHTASVIITVMISHIILYMPNYLISTTGSSTILNLFYVLAISMVLFYICSKIFELFPKQDFIDICEFVGGKPLKTIYGIISCIYFLTISGFVIRTFSESLVLIYFPNIDLSMVIIIFITITVIMNMIGFKAISRVTLITIPIILVAMIIIFISSVSNFVPQRVLPILGYGAYDTFVSGLSNIFAFSSIIIAPFLIPYIGSGKNFKKAGIIAIVIYFIYLLLGVIALLFLIPSITEINNTLSIYILSRRVNLGTFIQRIDALFILIWILSIFNYLAISMHFTLISFKKATNIKHKNNMLLCFSSFIYIVALIPRTISDVNLFDNTIYRYSSIAFVFIVTFIILVTAYFKKSKELRKENQTIE